MRTQADRDDDLAIGRELERKDAEIERLRADLATFGKDTVATENRIIDAEFKAQELRTVLVDCREFVAGMTKPAAPGFHTISSYHPCQALLDKIDAAIGHQQSMTEPK